MMCATEVAVCALLSELAIRAKHVDDLVLVHLFHVVASGTEVLAGVELSGLFSKSLTDGSSHGQAAVRVDVDFANS